MSDARAVSEAGAQDIYSAFLLLISAFEGAEAALPAAPGDGESVAIAYLVPSFDSTSRFDQMPWQLVRAALLQVYANLLLVSQSDSAEIVHQARVGWRRLRCTCRLLRSIKDLPSPPAADALRPLIDQLRELRDNDVVRLQTKSS
jgi:hypothetical protein